MPNRRSPAATERGTCAPRVLLIEDDLDTRQMYAEYLRFCGYAVVEAPDGTSAVVVATDFKPDVIVMDLAMPHVDGWEATRRLRADPQTRDTMILACTAYRLGRALERALEAGCDGVVLKPCLPEDLVREIERLLARGRTSSARAPIA